MATPKVDWICEFCGLAFADEEEMASHEPHCTGDREIEEDWDEADRGCPVGEDGLEGESDGEE